MGTLTLEKRTVWSFATILSVGILLFGITTIVVENDNITKSVDTVQKTIVENEKSNLLLRVNNLSNVASVVFRQSVSDVDFQASYASDLLNGSLPVESFYEHWSGLGPTPPGTTSNGYNSGYSYWYNNDNSDPDTNLNLNISSILDNSHRAMVIGNPSYAGMYIGFEDDGLWRHYPYIHVPTLPTFSYTCIATGLSKIGFDPRCRGWYNLADTNRDQVIFTSPYNDVSTGDVLITLAKAILNTLGDLIAVVGADITITSLENSILDANILSNGYTYLIDNAKNLVVYPSLARDRVYTVVEKEFTDSGESAAFVTILDTVIAATEPAQTTFTKSGATWYATYAPVAGTNYTMIMVVPESDITAPSDKIKEDGDNAVIGIIVAVIIGGIVALVIGICLAKRETRKIVAPINALNRSLDSVSQGQIDAQFSLGQSEYTEINEIQNKLFNFSLAIQMATNAFHKQNFGEALDLLNKVESMFNEINQENALGVVLGNKGNVYHKKSGIEKWRYEAERAFSASLKNAQGLLATAADKLRNNHDEQTSQLIEESIRLYKSTLSIRYLNRGEYYRQCKKYDDAHRDFDEGLGLARESENTLNMARLYGNKGLTFMDQRDFAQADECFNKAYTNVDGLYRQTPSKKTLQALQFASMNIGLHLKNRANNESLSPGEKDGYLKQAIFYLNSSLTLDNEMHRDVRDQSVASLIGIYEDGGNHAAAQKLRQMFPDVQIQNSGAATVTFLIDTSPSMDGPRIKSCTRTLRNIIANKMRDGDRISIYDFNTKMNRVVDLTELAPQTRGAIDASISALNNKCTGATYCYKSLLELGNIIKSNPIMNSSQWIIVLTDGEDNEEYFARNRQYGHYGRSTSPDDVKASYKENGLNLIVIAAGISANKQDSINALKMLAKDSPTDEYFIKTDGDASCIEKALVRAFDAANGQIVMETL
jgi:tetratricopeptide (TPR) repeat protein